MPTSSQIQKINSLTYADVVGLNLGIARMQGEDSVSYLKRCYESSKRVRNHSYEGALDEICVQLGLDSWAGISISSTDNRMVFTTRIGLVTVAPSAGPAVNVPTVTMARDNYWEWRKLSDVVADLNKISGVTASLSGPDGPALQIANQTNLFTVAEEFIVGIDQVLVHKNILPSSLVFSSAAGTYSLNPATGDLAFAMDPPAGLKVAYQYVRLPYNIVCSQVGLFGLVEPSLSTVGVSTDNVLAYQLREAVQAVMSADPCYWAD